MEGHDIHVTNLLTEEQLKKGCDILFYNRCANYNTEEQIDNWKKEYGFKIVVDVDDYWLLDPYHISYPVYVQYAIPEMIMRNIEKADLVTCTHARLENVVKQINDKTLIVPNAIPDHDQFTVKRIMDSKEVRLFWAGSITHQKDIEILRNPLKRVTGLNVNMVLGGYMPNQPAWDEIVSAYTNGLKIKGKLLQGKPPTEYYTMYQHADIALVPLKDTVFNSYKSNLKVLEAAHLNIPAIVSRVDPYLDFPQDTVCYVEHQSDWFKHINRLVNDPVEREWRGNNLKTYASKNFNFYDINRTRLDAFVQLAKNNIYKHEAIS